MFFSVAGDEFLKSSRKELAPGDAQGFCSFFCVFRDDLEERLLFS